MVTILGQSIFDAKLSKHHSYSSSLPKEGNIWQHDVYVNNYQDYRNYLGRDDEYEWCFDSLASNIVCPKMVTTSEPLINKKSELDNDFGFDEYEYFDAKLSKHHSYSSSLPK